MLSVSIDDVQAAANRIAKYVHQTPVLSSEQINRIAGCELVFKCENLQKCGAFKARGAHNALLQLTAEQLARGVATHSSGNHGAALSYAAKQLGTAAHIVMPENTSQAKIDAVKGYGGNITFCEATMAAREQTIATIVEATGASLIPPYDSASIIAGQGTAALELLSQVDYQLDALITPLGGGGLLGGTALVGSSLSPSTRIIGAEPEGANDGYLSFVSGEWQPQLAPNTIADGLRSSTGKLNFQIIQALVDEIVCVSDAEIINAMKLIWSRMKLVIEPSSATVLAAVLKNSDRFSGQKIGLILSGGNVDLNHLPWMQTNA
ncbi:MAG: pyridoxal-phosphate dependent enzyme [Pseudomonadales bacterium]